MTGSMSNTISPLAPAAFPEMPPVAGVRLATAAAGIRYPGRTDVLLALFDPGTAVSGGAGGGGRRGAGALVPSAPCPRGAAGGGGRTRTAVTICGIAKGAGMIAPDMGTMLSFVFTDAPIAPAVLKALLRDGVADTFNPLTIDGDTSTPHTPPSFAPRAAATRGVGENAPPS